LLVCLIIAQALGQADPPDQAEALRAGIDENLPDPATEQAEAPQRPIANRNTRTYGHPSGSGAGGTGYLSTNLPRPALKAGAEEAEEGDLRPARPQRNAAAAAARKKRTALQPGKAVAGKAAVPAADKNPLSAAAVQPDPGPHGIAAPEHRRPRKPPAEEDAFAPVGIRAGAFLIRPAIEITTGYDSNPARVSEPRGSSLLILAPELRVDSDWERHALTANIRGSYTDYPAVPFADRPFADAKIAGRIDATRDLRIDLETRYLLSTENPGSPNLQAGLAKLPIYTDVGGSAGIDRRFNRLDVSLKGTIDRFDYQNSLLTDGTSASNKDRDYNQYGAQARAGYEITPGLKPFLELDADTRVHDFSVDRFGYARDSEALTPKVGTTFELTRKLTGEISVGYLVRAYKDPRLADLRGLLADASLVWTATALTTVKLTAVSAADESVVPGVSGLFRREAGIEIDHAFRRWLLGTLKLGWGLDDYVGLDREDKRYAVSLGLIYKLSREMQLKGELRESWLRSNVSGVDYTATAILVGLRLQR